jgi:3-phosphoshikimate 1-carboxyvinyltransferase
MTGLPPYAVQPLVRPPDASVVVPGSKSITNRAVLAAGLATGDSRLLGLLRADDTAAMVDAVRALGADVVFDETPTDATIRGIGGREHRGELTIDARLSGTTSRFLLPALAIGPGPATLDGAPPLRLRPMADGVDAVRALGVEVVELGEVGRLPVVVRGGARNSSAVRVRGDVSSQFLSGLLLAGPCLPGGLRVSIEGSLVSRPYVVLTIAVMEAFGAQVTERPGDSFEIAATGYTGTHLDIEPDASAASYFLAAAAITGGRVRIEGLGSASTQGDVRFADVLEAMGATVIREPQAIEVRGTGVLRGVDLDLGEISDTAQTLAAVAVFADAPTTVRGIGFIRAKETDRIAAVVAELRRCGIHAEEFDDGFVIHPGSPQPAVVQTYDDHRMAMSFALIGLRAPGIEIADPGCVAKTFPNYFATLESLRGS